ncbi:MAG: hypothetical protein K9I94_15490 [Bacteroidales bacterium]|nr:hypothetical protein [Bacteroidales bacterium]
MKNTSITFLWQLLRVIVVAFGNDPQQGLMKYFIDLDRKLSLVVDGKTFG